MAEADQQKSRRFFGWTNVGILFFIYGAVYGFIFYAFTVVFPEMIQAQGWPRDDAAVAHTLRAVSLGALAPLVALAIGKLGAKRTMVAGLSFGAIVLAVLSLFTTELWQWTLLWGILMPIGFCFGGAVPIQTTLTYWFNVRRATALGVVLSAAAFFGFIAAPLYTWFMQLADSWRAGWGAAGIFCALALVASLFMKSKPEDIGQFPDGIDPDAPPDEAGSSTVRKPRTYRTSEIWTLRECLRQPVLYFLGLCTVAQASAVYLLTTHGILHFTDLGFTKMQGALAMGNFILFSGFARLPSGFLGDRIEPRWIMATALTGMGLALIGIWRPPDDFFAVLVIMSIFGFCFGAIVPIFPAIIGNYFGPSVFAPITGFLSPVMILIAAPVPVVAGRIYERYGSYDFAFMYIIALTFVTVLLASMLVPPKKKPRAIDPEQPEKT